MKVQYAFVKQSRELLLEYCAGISPSHLLKENSAFGRGSIRNLLVHIANVYEFWVGQQGLGREITFTSFESRNDIKDIIQLFKEVDLMVEAFIDHAEESNISEIVCQRNGKTEHLTPLKLFTHVITHEYHHKGQILSLSRHLGYVPVDTDVIR